MNSFRPLSSSSCSVLGGLQLAWAEVWHPLLGRWWHHDKIYMHLISSTKLLPTWLIQMKAGNTTHKRAASWQIQSDYIITLLLLAPFKTLLCFFPFIQAFTKLLKECVIMYKVAVLQSFHKKFPETLNDADPSHSLVSRCEPTSIKKWLSAVPFFTAHSALCLIWHLKGFLSQSPQSLLVL